MVFTRSLLFPIGLTTFLLAIDGAITLGLVSSMVAFLHSSGRGPFPVAPPGGSPFLLTGEPANLVVNQGHTTNAAGGTALILVGFGGIIALWLERRERKKWDRTSPAFYAWAVIVLLSWLLTLVALIYTFVETSMTGGQVIDLGVAEANPPPAKYPNDRWTPENWYAAVLGLPLASDNLRRLIGGKLAAMRAWRWNLIALFILGFVLLLLVVLELWRLRRRNTQRVSMVEVLSDPSEEGGGKSKGAALQLER
ncbi:hypothetical protein C8A00DRAFT_29615 [Chaetomidium leptoderma]|uniref:Uncharacterized protein n=1 Tax=Chaetomidium leptoderma TaxID=669021 RepID=A0AAN6VV91_9PEZI|nr:hypothetical protein C8A00DRAFT_29615 [Chaetomidium leptoderma]